MAGDRKESKQKRGEKRKERGHIHNFANAMPPMVPLTKTPLGDRLLAVPGPQFYVGCT